MCARSLTMSIILLTSWPLSRGAVGRPYGRERHGPEEGVQEAGDQGMSATSPPSLCLMSSSRPSASYRLLASFPPSLRTLGCGGYCSITRTRTPPRMQRRSSKRSGARSLRLSLFPSPSLSSPGLLSFTPPRLALTPPPFSLGPRSKAYQILSDPVSPLLLSHITSPLAQLPCLPRTCALYMTRMARRW